MIFETLRSKYYEWQRGKNEKLFDYFSERRNKIKDFFSIIFLTVDLSLSICFCIFLILFFSILLMSNTTNQVKFIMYLVLSTGFYNSILRIFDIWNELKPLIFRRQNTDNKKV